MRSWTIYVLSDPETPDDVRYVGVTHHSLKRRLSVHLARSKGMTYHSARWVRKVVSSGVVPLITAIHTGEGDSWGSVEAWWIQWHRERGYRLTNITNGGEGTPGRVTSPETRAKLSISLKGVRRSAEYRAKSSVAHTGYRHSDAAKMKMRVASTGRRHSADVRAKMSASAKGRQFSADTRAKLRSAQEGKKLSIETRAKIGAAAKGLKRSPETRARMSVAAKAACARRRLKNGGSNKLD
jgi:hypothetical protein